MTESAQAAKAIRQELKKEFPTVTFSVTSQNFSGGNSVRVEWTDGPTSEQVDAFIGKYQYGSFDGMTDSYNMDNCRNDMPQAKYVQSQRDISEPLRARAAELMAKAYGVEKMDDATHFKLFGCYCPCRLNRIIYAADFRFITVENMAIEIKDGRNVLVANS